MTVVPEWFPRFLLEKFLLTPEEKRELEERDDAEVRTGGGIARGDAERLVEGIEPGDKVPIPDRKNPVTVTSVEPELDRAGAKASATIHAEGSRGGEYTIWLLDWEGEQESVVSVRRKGARGRVGIMNLDEWFQSLHTDGDLRTDGGAVVVTPPADGCPDCGGTLDLRSDSPLGGPEAATWWVCRDCGWEGQA